VLLGGLKATVRLQIFTTSLGLQVVAENGTGWIPSSTRTLVERPGLYPLYYYSGNFWRVLAAKSPVRQDVVPASKKPDKDAALV